MKQISLKSRNYQIYSLCGLFLFLLCALNGLADEVEFSEIGDGGISADDLISRVHIASTTEFRNAVGYYVVRHYAKHDEEKDAKAIEEVRLALEDSLEERIRNDKKFGVTTNVEKIREENLSALDDLEKIYKETATTEVVRYTVEGDNYRIERVFVSNAESLEKIRQNVLAGQIDLSASNVLTWNGKVSAEIIALNTETSTGKDRLSNENSDNLRSSISYGKIGKLPEFMDYGRYVKDEKIFDLFKGQKLPLSTASITIDGEQGVLLRVGSKNTEGFLLETSVLPSKGYVVAFSRVKVNDAVMTEDHYRDFVKVNDGSWLPTRITKTNYKIDQQGVPYVATKKELLAIESPMLNVELPKDFFDLANTKEFQSPSPLFREAVTEKDYRNVEGWFSVRLIFVFAGIVFIAIALLAKWKKWRSLRHG
jgi:hypothetical protein